MAIKARIEKRMKKKQNPELVELIKTLKRLNPELAKLIARPKRMQIEMNLDNIKPGNLLIPGKLLGRGEGKKAKIVALSASQKAIDKLKSAGGEFVPLEDELKKNPELKNLDIIWQKQ
ncbi:MAG: uL15 family ribosomal protein [Candidatus Nanoarchaeia archaeon]